MRVFKEQERNKELVKDMTDAAHEHALILFDRRKNAETMLEIYGKVCGRE